MAAMCLSLSQRTARVRGRSTPRRLGSYDLFDGSVEPAWKRAWNVYGAYAMVEFTQAVTAVAATCVAELVLP